MWHKTRAGEYLLSLNAAAGRMLGTWLGILVMFGLGSWMTNVYVAHHEVGAAFLGAVFYCAMIEGLRKKFHFD